IISPERGGNTSTMRLLTCLIPLMEGVSVCSTTAFHSLPLFVSLCDLCGKSFTLAQSLKKHQVIHSGVKPYSCDLCGKSFTLAGNLKTHQVIHSGVKAYNCDLCGKSFTQSQSLKTHQLIHSGFKNHFLSVS
uniref:C2H2-type domain-containing protein n=1 Tax=Oreochromis aureus TaxID=47969 RepID=A0AAZ1Y3T8_OREAU